MSVADGETTEVVGLRRVSSRTGRRGVVLALALIAAFAATHPSWRVVRTFVTFEVVTALWAAGRAVWKLRSQLEDAEPLPIHAVEVVRARPRPWRPKDAIVLAAIAAGIAAAVMLAHASWLLQAVGAGLLAAGIAFGVFEPLAEAFLVSRWERSHGDARLFRASEHSPGEDEELFVADRPVPDA